MAHDTADFLRFDGRYEKDAAGCWLWKTASRYAPAFRFDGKTVAAHRFAYERWNGPVPPGADVVRTCNSIACVNPDHLLATDHATGSSRNAYKRTEAVLVRIERWISAPDDNGCIRWSGVKAESGYGVVKVAGKAVGAHRAVYEALYGDLDRGNVIDHVCGVRDCVNPQHLRVVTTQQNNEHRVQLTSANTSGYPNVWYAKRWRKWQTSGNRHGQRVHLGYHATAWDAYCAWREWAKVNMPFVDDRMLNMDKRDAPRPQ